MFGTVTIAWQWLRQASAAKHAIASDKDSPFYQGKLCAAQYWINTELARVGYLAAVCRSGEDSYARMQAEWF